MEQEKPKELKEIKEEAKEKTEKKRPGRKRKLSPTMQFEQKVVVLCFD